MQRDLRRRSLKSILIGDRAFYAMVLMILLPMIVQNAITHFVNLLDNIMVGQVGTEQMSGVAIANQLLFVFNLCVFGGMAGPGIFSAQFQGANNQEGVRNCFRYKLYLGIALIAVTSSVFLLGGKALISRFLHDEADPVRVETTLRHGIRYLRLMLLGLPPFVMSQIYASTLRESGETRLPMIAGIVAVFVNLFFNYILIFGHLGFSPMGVAGAAIATIISRFVELTIVVVFSHANSQRYRFVKGVYRHWAIPGKLAQDITVKGLPLLINEFLWSLGMTKLNQCYSLRGLDVVAAMNIASTISNLFAVTIFSTGGATAIIVGQRLGSNDLEGARTISWRLIAFNVFAAVCTGLVMFFVSPFIPRVYNTTPEVRALAVTLLRIFALCMGMMAYANSAYFILRSGGKTMITFLFDSGYTWVVAVPAAWLLIHLTSLSVATVYLVIMLLDILKILFGQYLLQKGVWINSMVA